VIIPIMGSRLKAEMLLLRGLNGGDYPHARRVNDVIRATMPSLPAKPET
jgi:hypothetical protein